MCAVALTGRVDGPDVAPHLPLEGVREPEVVLEVVREVRMVTVDAGVDDDRVNRLTGVEQLLLNGLGARHVTGVVVVELEFVVPLHVLDLGPGGDRGDLVARESGVAERERLELIVARREPEVAESVDGVTRGEHDDGLLNAPVDVEVVRDRVGSPRRLAHERCAAERRPRALDERPPSEIAISRHTPGFWAPK